MDQHDRSVRADHRVADVVRSVGAGRRSGLHACPQRATPPTSSSASSDARCSITNGCASAGSTRSRTPATTSRATVNDERLIIARAKDGAIHAFSAICQHRGMQIVDDCGNCGTFTCPYHQWVYGLDGRLLGAPGDGTHRGLHQVGVGAAQPAGRGVARLRVRQLRRERAAAWPRRWRATNRSSSTTTSPTRRARAASRSPTCRGTGR